jgi:hypothetical protein
LGDGLSSRSSTVNDFRHAIQRNGHVVVIFERHHQVHHRERIQAQILDDARAGLRFRQAGKRLRLKRTCYMCTRISSDEMKSFGLNGLPGFLTAA